MIYLFAKCLKAEMTRDDKKNYYVISIMLTELVLPKKLSLQFTAWLTAICIEKQHSNHLNHAETLTQEDVAKIRIQLPDPMKLREQSSSLLRPAVSLLHLT